MPDKNVSAPQTHEPTHKHEPVAHGMPTLLSQTEGRAPLNDTVQRAVVAPHLLKPANVLALQRAAGNHAVTRWLGRVSAAPFVQFKLTVGAAHDAYEQEADLVADQVMSAPESQPPAHVSGQRLVQRADEEEELQTQPLAGSIAPVVQRATAEADKDQTTALVPQAVEEERKIIHTRRESTLDGFEAGDDIESRLNATRGSGAPLPAETREFMESRFGADFKDVRIHQDSTAAQLSRVVSAQAFTHGRDIYLGEGNEDLASSAGKRLLAHELTHTLQQGASSLVRSAPAKKESFAPEQAQDQLAPSSAVAGPVVNHISEHASSSPALQREWKPDPTGKPGDRRWHEPLNGGLIWHWDAAAQKLYYTLDVNPQLSPEDLDRLSKRQGERYTYQEWMAAGWPGLKTVEQAPGDVQASPGALTPAAGLKAPSPAPEDWSSLNGQQLLAKINMRNCSWAALARVLGKTEKELTETWQRQQGVLAPQEHLRTERAWATAMVGLDKLKAGAAAGPAEFTKVVASLEMRIDEKKGGYDVAQSYGLQKMILDAVLASGGDLGSGGASASAAYRFGDAGTDQFKTKAEILTALNAFPVGTRFVVFLHGRAAGGAGEGGHYVAADRASGGVEFVDNQFEEGTTTPRGKMDLEGGWPKVHKDFKYESWVDGAFLALAPQALAALLPGLEPITPAAVDRYRVQNVQTSKVPQPPAWLASLTEGVELYQHSASQKSATGEGRVTVTASDGKLFEYRADKGGWIVYVKPVAARNVPAAAPAGPAKTVATGGKASGFAAFAGQMGGSKVTKVAVSGIIPVPASDLMLKADVGKVAHTPPQWYGQVVADVSAQIAQDLQRSKAELTKKDHKFPGPGQHIYDDGTVIAMASGITRMLEYLGISAGKPVIIPELGKTMFVLPQDRFAYLQSLSTGEDHVKRLFGSWDVAIAVDAALLRRHAVREYIATQAKQKVDVTEAEAEQAILGTYGTNPGRTSEGKVIFNEAMMKNLAQDPSTDAQAFVHVVIHEFMHANSEGGGGQALAGHDHLNQQHEEGVTDLIARAISDAINAARNVDNPADAAVKPAVQKAVAEIKVVTFGSNGGVRYQSEVDLVIARISDVDMLKNVVTKAYFTPEAKAEVVRALG